jgi:hypothetical protein
MFSQSIGLSFSAQLGFLTPSTWNNFQEKRKKVDIRREKKGTKTVVVTQSRKVQSNTTRIIERK